ncbi:hypothetical protein L486_00023 [Kwoniella mangroviensis CBS 10435]|uniref:Zn(2)-C6 fungal-type domain-containing protein n=1 Tax=Kwoniella mangroviensis CBS 10435 TaxID=1331196 RepID=A0A1B9IXY5_9TREE|nr:hypothetical protein L486_00023 [Kwoniella mangroviensis CBS 10435]
MARPYNPKYDSVLGPMREPSPPPPSTEAGQHAHAFPHDPSFLAQLDPSRVGVNDTEAALTHLFGDVVGQSQQDEKSQGNPPDADEYTPTLASHEVPNVVEKLPVPTPPTGTDNNDEPLDIDPSLQPQDDDTGIGSVEGAGTSVPAKRKATSRANMLARGGACEYCKKRKLKCSAEVPSCSNCKKINKECVYSQKKQRSKIRVLEDRLQELEKRLDHPNLPPSTPHPITNTVETTIEGEGGLSIDTFPTLSTFEIDEPDLMTLADAAAGDANVEFDAWEGLSPEIIVGEIIKAITSGRSHDDGEGKSIGGKIVSHLIHLYVTPPSIPDIHAALSSTALLRRLSDKGDRPIHPSLLLALIPYLLPLSPSKTLHSPTLPTLIQTHGKNLINLAITNSDPRVIDLATACVLRAFWYYTESKYFEGWMESSLAIGWIRSAGLDKLGYVGERYTSHQQMTPEREARLERERKFRFAFSKPVSIPPPKDGAELGERINLFWFAYMVDRGGSFAGWRWPSSISDEEITTPWPKAEYGTDGSLLDNRTILDFINPSIPEDASQDSLEAASVKALTLVFHAQRLFDTPPSVSTPDRTSLLISITKRYISTYGSVEQTVSPVTCTNGGSKNQVWITLYATLAFLHAREEVDAPKGIEKNHFLKSIEAIGNVLDVVKIMQNAGNAELEGLGLFSGLLLFHLCRLTIKYIERFSSSQPSEHGSADEENRKVLSDLKGMRLGLNNALNTLVKKTRFAVVGSQLLENIALGSEFKTGEYERPDNIV